MVASAPEVSGADLLEAVLTARGSINDAGGTATTLAASGAVLAAADGARDANGALMFPGGFAAVTGLTRSPCPAWTRRWSTTGPACTWCSATTPRWR